MTTLKTISLKPYVLCLYLLILSLIPTSIEAAQFCVNDTGTHETSISLLIYFSSHDPVTDCQVSCTDSNTTCSFTKVMAAIEEHSDTGATHEISFNLPASAIEYNQIGQPVYRLHQVTGYPWTLNNRHLIIDGRTQPNYQAIIGPNIELNGSLAFNNSTHIEIAGLSIYNSVGAGIKIQNSQNANIHHNIIGSDISNRQGIGNNLDGIHITRSENVIITNNVISSNNGHGVHLQSVSSSSVSNNLIGLTNNGSAPLPNGDSGIRWDGFSNDPSFTNIIDNNVVSGNGTYGIELAGHSYDFSIHDNLIGTDSSGYTAIPNSVDGITSFAFTRNINISDNLISGNGHFGLFLDGEGHHIHHNTIGLNILGLQSLANEQGGIRVGLHTGSTDAIYLYENIISGNGGFGVHASSCYYDRPGSLFIEDNVIGLDRVANSLGNNGPGILVWRAATIRGNTISGNRSHGIESALMSYAEIENNSIGTDVSGTASRGNLGDGIFLPGESVTGSEKRSYNNMIRNNTIANNTGNGITVNDSCPVTRATDCADGNTFLSNLIYRNQGLPIDLQSGLLDIGFTVNDYLDSDEGGNNLQNHPELINAEFNSTRHELTLIGSLDTWPEQNYIIQIFSDTNNLMRYIGESTVHSDLFGHAGFTETVSVPTDITLFSNDTLVATATGLTNGSGRLSNTSEMSPSEPISVVSNGVPINWRPLNNRQRHPRNSNSRDTVNDLRSRLIR